MNDGAILLRNILEVPGDDAARLVYADWLQENGQPERAEFIRVQVELIKPDPCGMPQKCIHGPARRPFGPGQTKPSCGLPECKQRDRMRNRHDYLTNQYVRDCKGFSREFIVPLLGAKWLQLSAPWQWFWERGFIFSIELPCAAFLEHAEAIFRAHPVTSVRLSDRRPVEQFDGYILLRRNHAGSEIGLGDELFDLLPLSVEDDTEELCTGYPIFRDFERRRADGALYLTPQRAETALSRACVALGRKRADLSPLPEPQRA